MIRADDWQLGFAKQAWADWRAYEVLSRERTLAPCERFHLLQMACEKLCKAHLCGFKNVDLNRLQSTHTAIAGSLVVIVRQHFVLRGLKAPHAQSDLSRRIRHLAREIELLAPSVDAGGRRPDNCEYPWDDGAGRVCVPAEFHFPGLSLLNSPAGWTLLKVVRQEIHRLAT